MIDDEVIDDEQGRRVLRAGKLKTIDLDEATEEDTQIIDKYAQLNNCISLELITAQLDFNGGQSEESKSNKAFSWKIKAIEADKIQFEVIS